MTDNTELVEPWLVWSNEHRAFWGPNRCGYTGKIEQAGRYSREEAENICRYAAPRANSDIYKGTPPEICMPAPEALERQSAEIARLRAAFAEDALFAFLTRKYVQRADDRQKAMGLQYTTAETHGLAKDIAQLARAALQENDRAE